ncbi:hypothetical protein PR202_gb08264 [Eleusine coracana subsp. coracana]|uniref:RNA helicase n=1 Tax=Eleusine coracana subsp. coracana TaxID=191504 RepID=A0AAV5EDP6_ELECO|nr:hypothetical protein PR202_gb08264 [Eleusine coracana subsp. coracana]
MLLHSSAYRGSFLLSSCASGGRLPSFAFALAGASSKTLGALRTLTAMSYRGGPNSHRGRGRGGGGGGRGGRGGGGGRGEQRWWDPQWRAERLRQIHGEVEKVDENEWWNKISQLRGGPQQELVVKQNFGRDGQNILANMAQRQGLYFNAYNKGKTLVFSKAPLPDYRADLDERHGSTQKEIKMSNQTERRVEDLLSRAKSNANDSASASTSTVSIRQSLPGTVSSVVEPAAYIDKEKLSSQLRDLQNMRKMTASARSMQSFREKLPAFNMREGFLKAVAANQVRLFKPRRISAISVAARVASERGEELGETVGYQIRLESKRLSIASGIWRFSFRVQEGGDSSVLVQEPDLAGVSHILVDEIHERGMNEDFLIIILRDLLPRRPDLRLVLMSATINAELFSKYFGDVPIMHIPGFTFPVTEFFLEDFLEKTGYKIKPECDQSPGSSRRKKVSSFKVDPLSEVFEDIDINKEYGNYSVITRQSLEAWSATELDLTLVESTIEYICRYEEEGAILVFLTGWDEISKLLDKIKGNSFLGSPNKFLALPLHGSMPTVNQREIFDRPPANMRKIVLATNIAESSITIDDVVYVIDCGKAKETSYDALNKLACLLPSWISKASAHQLPEILRTPLQELCLTIKSLQLGAVASFLSKALQPPDPLSVKNAIELLKTIGALDDMEELTSLGEHLCTLPLDPNIGKMLLMGSVFQCLDPVLTIAAALAYRNPFVLPIDRKEEADAVKRSFAGDSCSDHIALLKAFVAWKEAKRSGRERSFCWENFLSPMTLKMMDDMRNQFFDLLSDIGFVNKTRGVKAYNHYSSDMEMVCAVLCAGLYPNVVQCKRRGKRTAFYTKDVGKVDIHPSSVNAFVNQFPLPYLVYSEKVKTASIYVRDSTNISEYALLLFGGSLSPSKTGEGIEMLGGYLHFSASKRIIELIQVSDSACGTCTCIPRVPRPL